MIMVCVITALLAVWCLFSVIQFAYYWYFQRVVQYTEYTDIIPFADGNYYIKKNGNLAVNYEWNGKTVTRIYNAEDIEIKKGDCPSIEDITVEPILCKSTRFNLFYSLLKDITENEVEHSTCIVVP